MSNTSSLRARWRLPRLAPEPYQVLMVAVFATLGVIFTGPRDSWLVDVLLLANVVLLLGRLLPDEELSPLVFVVIGVINAVAAAGLVAAASQGFPELFAMLATGSAGFRLPTRTAAAIAVLTGVLCMLVSLIPIGPGHRVSPWWVGLIAITPVVLGMINRGHRERLRTAQAALAQADRAAQAEARESILAERARIARDVHDLLAHSLASINMQLELADALLDAGQVEPAQQATRQAQQIARQGMAETRRTVFALRESTLPLTETLTTMVRASQGELTVTGQTYEVAAGAAQALVRAVQESLTNAHKYAPGAGIEVTLGFAADRVSVQVVNGAAAGVGRPLARTGSGMGLVGMRERVVALGGTVTAGPILDGPASGGWQVRVELPGTGR